MFWWCFWDQYHHKVMKLNIYKYIINLYYAYFNFLAISTNVASAAGPLCDPNWQVTVRYFELHNLNISQRYNFDFSFWEPLPIILASWTKIPMGERQDVRQFQWLPAMQPWYLVVDWVSCKSESWLTGC